VSGGTGPGLETAAARVRGLGAAGEGAREWWHERLSSVALLVLLVWLAVSFVRLPDLSYATIGEWLKSPWAAVPMILLVLATFWHSRLGLKVIVDDYVHDQANRFLLLILVDFALAVGAALALFSVLSIALGGAAA
jgi:succinate dehydrogenase / fumarate reductase membrane anchor subunit